MHFLSLRADSHAQYEIRQYADIMLDIVKKWVPFAFSSFEKYRIGGIELSKNAIDVINKKLQGENISQENSSLSKREWIELSNIISINE